MAGNVGGRVEITINGRTYHPVAEVEVEGAGVEVQTEVNQDGTIGRSVKPKPYMVDIKYRDMGGLSMQQLMSESFDFSMRERETGKTILLTNAFHEGTPKRNTTTGEISGLKVVSDQYREISRS